ncbi:hypothetical protein HDU97_008785 [Phlyctochytrium planicorne]|nr:hypothetical protein HDU97_008785 [Phlyctochytrium planicorne]
MNPFEEDPFSDPSISTALSTSAYVTVDTSVPSPTKPNAGASFDNSAANAVTARELAAKEEALRKKEEELAERERALREQQETLRSHGLNPPNWPPFYPLIYHNIDDEIPEHDRPLMLKIYRYWLATIGVLFFNIIACLGILISHSTYYGSSDFGISIIYFGLSGSGSGGIINMITVLSDGKVAVAVLCIIATVGWALDAVGAFFLWTTVNNHAKRGGHSLESARTQAVTMGVLRSV